jgi:signal transduction histidine kinase/CheY-like chemotaxis protein
MNESTASFEPDLRISHKWVLIVLVLLGQALYLLSDVLPDTTTQLRLTVLATLLYALAASVWLLDRWKPWLGRWFMIAALVAMIYLGNSWLDVPGFLTLMVIPTALAATLISLPAATMTAFGQTVLLLLLPNLTTPNINLAAIIIAVLAIWAMLGVMYAAYHPIHEVADWSWGYFQQAQISLEEAQDHKVELEQALDDLAQANLQLTRLNSLAQGLRQAAEDARAAKEEFVANVSHELRTPLNMITGFSEMILQTPKIYGAKIPSRLLADLTVIYRNAKHLADLVDDVLDLSQIEAGQMALTKEHVQIQEIIEGATVAVRPLFDSKGLYLKTDVQDNLPLIFCDRTRIREVLLNLLSNAGRFTEQGGVQVRVWLEESNIAVSVADTGSGIATEDISKLFQPFQQIDTSIRRHYGGSGLGLNISKRFIELHGGKIWVESEKGIGTTFFFQLPVASPQPLDSDFMRGFIPDWEYIQRTRPSKAPKAQVQPRFVVLERGDSVQRLLARYLDKVEIVPVTNLEEAVVELSGSPSQALLINDMSPERAMQQLETVALPTGTPTIVCSVPGTYESANIIGASDYLIKPISQNTLLAALNRLELPGKTVLIVDDEPDALQLFRRMLLSSDQNYRVLRARDGQEAINLLREYHPDVILLDLVMPNMDGFQILKAKSEDSSLSDIPVIVTSAQDPTGHPVVSDTLTVTCRGGLSIHRLLTCIKTISEAFSTLGPMQTTASPD